jgi:hypothetical protein
MSVEGMFSLTPRLHLLAVGQYHLGGLPPTSATERKLSIVTSSGLLSHESFEVLKAFLFTDPLRLTSTVGFFNYPTIVI